MTPKETKQAADVMLAWADGKKIQCYHKWLPEPEWQQAPNPVWDWAEWYYRIAPEPMEVEVLYHPATRDFMRSDRLTHEHARQLGWTLCRATIHPETK